MNLKQIEELIDILSFSFRQYIPRFAFKPTKDKRLLWFKMFLIRDGKVVKFDIIQNVPFMFPPEKINGIKMLAVKDIALMKIASTLRRASLKDIYDLNHLTNHVISLPDLWNLFSERQKKHGNNINIFSVNQFWDPLTLFDALADVRKEFNPTDFEKAVIPQKGFPTIFEAFNQWNTKVKNLSKILEPKPTYPGEV